MERFLKEFCDVRSLSPLVLAFVGDAAFELLVRERLACRGNRPVNDLHRASVRQVCAGAQAGYMEKLLPILTPEEGEIFRRGRNAHTNHVPKNSDTAGYHAATGFECLFGFLYLNGRVDRLRELFELICGDN